MNVIVFLEMNGIIKNPGWMSLGQKHRSDESNLQQLGWRALIDHLWTKVTLSFDVRVFLNKQHHSVGPSPETDMLSNFNQSGSF